jgi:hypothetical protein
MKNVRACPDVSMHKNQIPLERPVALRIFVSGRVPFIADDCPMLRIFDVG